MKEKITTDIKNIIQKVMGEMLQTTRGKQPIDLDKGEATIGKPKNRDDNLETILTDPSKQEFQAVRDSKPPEWANEMEKMKRSEYMPCKAVVGRHGDVVKTNSFVLAARVSPKLSFSNK